MDVQRQRPAYGRKAMILLAALMGAGLVGNVCALGLFTGFNYLFGSIATLLVVSLFGPWWGLLSGVIASAWTIVLFGHPYAMIWLCAEPLFVGWLLKRGRPRNVILCDALYWACLGSPLVWLFFRHVMQAPLLGTVAAMLMYAVIGITNALAVSILLAYVPHLTAIGRDTERRTIPIHNLIFNLMMAAVVMPTLVIMVIHGKDAERRYLQDLYASLEESSRAALYETRLSLQKQLFTLSGLEKQSDGLDLSASGASLPSLQHAVEHARTTVPDLFLVYIGTPGGRSLVYAPDRNEQGESTAGLDFSDREYFKTIRRTQKPCVSDIFITRGAVATSGIALAFPFVSGGEFRGYAAAAVRLSFFADLLAATRVRLHHHLSLVDNTNRVITSTDSRYAPMEPFDPCPDGTLVPVSGSIQRCMPGASSPLPLWQRVQQSRYILRTPVSNDIAWNLTVETPFAPYQQLLFRDHIKSLLILLVLNVLALTVSLAISRRLVAPLARLSQVTSDLPERLVHEKVVAWPESMVREIDHLIGNFRAMAGALGEKFQEISFDKEALEQRVEERTRELTWINEELKQEIAEHTVTGQQRDHLMSALEVKNKELEGLIYVASHDLRSPLVNVQGFSRKLIKSCADLEQLIDGLGLDARQRAQFETLLRETIPKSLGFIAGSAERMDALLNGLLRLSRLGRAALCFERLDMRAILAKIVSSMTYQIESVGAKVELGSLAPCLADAMQVTQIFSNLLDNAVKYRSPLRPLQVRVFSEETDEGVRYCVEDNGIGIPPDQQDKIWEIFHRLNPQESPGEGLGLTTARRIVDRLGGSIWVESAPDSGSRFYVVLPRPPEEDRTQGDTGEVHQ
ncbi:MAG TPA: ATP-binding protein [Desulfuromonadaceae bacterium]